MGQLSSGSKGSSPQADVLEDSPYANQDAAALRRLVAERGIKVARSGYQDTKTLTTLLCAYDAGLQAGGGQGMHSGQRNNTDPTELDECPTVLSVLQKIRDSPGHMGVDIGGSLVKMALALPIDLASEHCFPENFGLTGRTHCHLEFGMRVCGEVFVIRFISGSTSQMERAVQHLGMRRSSKKSGSPARFSSPKSKASTPTASEPFTPDSLDWQESGSSFDRSLSGWSDFGSASYRPVRRVAAAGGGACKLAALFRDALRVEIEPVKELAAVVDGLLVLASHASTAPAFHNVGSTGETCAVTDLFALTGNSSLNTHKGKILDLFTLGADGKQMPLPWPDTPFPFILVNMGSGVSILRVDSEAANDYVRVGGTACGGGTFLGLARALTSACTFEEALALAAEGDASHVDKLVSDIYGVEGSASLGLPGNLTASNFGKLSDNCRCSEPDLARALLQMVTQQSVLLATAFARHANCLDRVFFVGGFVDEPNHIARTAIAANFRSLGGCAYFLRHSDFLGALGSLKCAFEVMRGQ
mmetsp:Transcript_85621/g.169933  ORF Transcript_85621/g.169933 Transcript_85621/m.169933 type:complete len:531 (+) Transcript_85621:61-1653(+)